MPSHPLVTTDDLRDLLGSVTVLDVRWSLGGPSGLDAYRAGHVPGASYVDLDADLADPPGIAGRHPLPDEGRFVAAMRRAGVSTGRPVVVYDDWQGRSAARAWWLLRFHGHTDVRVLDGGWAAWLSSGGPVATGEEAAVEGDFTALSAKGMRLVTATEVPEVDVVLDARAPERFTGAVEPVDAVAGHIPGARNMPTDRNLRPEGGFRSAEDLREAYADVGARPGADVTAYCGSGVTAAHAVLAMEVAGIRAGLYADSWSGWITDPSRPVARGTGG